jgi:glycosyltransferase involved in cell wall biosynthesis
VKILHSIRSVDPRGGGPIEGIKQLSAMNRQNGHAVEILSLDAPTDSCVADFPFKLHTLGPVNTKYGYTPELTRWARTHAPAYDAVIVNGIWQYTSFGMWRALRGTHTPYFVFTHGMLDPWFKRAYPLKHLKKWLYWPWAEYRVLRDARAVLFTSEEERRLARQSFWLYRCSEVVVNYGTATPPGDSAAQRKLFFETFPQLQGKRLLLFLGRIHVKKGCDLAVQAFARVAQGDDTLHLVVAGPDQTGWGAALQDLAAGLGVASRVTWPGMLEGGLKWGALRAAEVFLLPSHQENFGVAVVEALACGVPVLISNKVNIWREIQVAEAGLVDQDDLAGTVRLCQGWLALSRVEQERMRQRTRPLFERRFEIAKVAENFIDVLRANAGAWA